MVTRSPLFLHSFLRKTRLTLEMIKFEHSVFALPFALTGALLAWRESAAMGAWLILHLGWVAGLFLTLPYGKFVHALYRFAALARFHVERRRPLPQLGSE